MNRDSGSGTAWCAAGRQGAPTKLCNLLARSLQLIKRPQAALVELDDVVLGLQQGSGKGRER